MRNTGGRNAGTINGGDLPQAVRAGGRALGARRLRRRGAHGEGAGGLAGGRHGLRRRADGRVPEAPVRGSSELSDRPPRGRFAPRAPQVLRRRRLEGRRDGDRARAVRSRPTRTAKKRLSVETPLSTVSPGRRREVVDGPARLGRLAPEDLEPGALRVLGRGPGDPGVGRHAAGDGRLAGAAGGARRAAAGPRR